MIDVSINNIKTNDRVNTLHLDKLAQFVLQKEGNYKNACVSINFVDTKKIHHLNKNYRNIDAPTDVLSFECDGVNDQFNTDEVFDYGDIFICYEIALQNSKKFNTCINNELKLLIVHGMLHLCGYDHIVDAEAEIMENKEEELLDLWDLETNIIG